MRLKKPVFALCLALIAGFSSCKKDDDDEDPDPTPVATPENHIPAQTDAFGAVVAIKTANYVDVPGFGTINQAIGIGVGVFGNLVSASYVDAGTVSTNNSSLTKQTNNSYVYTPSAANPSGIDFNDDVSWTVSGNSGNGVPAFTHTPVNQMPSDPNYTGSTSISRSAAFTLASSVAITGADSVIYSVIGNGVNLTRIVAGDVQSVPFTAAEMATVPAGNGYIQIVPYNISAQVFDGKKICFINETVVTKSVTFN